MVVVAVLEVVEEVVQARPGAEPALDNVGQPALGVGDGVAVEERGELPVRDAPAAVGVERGEDRVEREPLLVHPGSIF